MDSKSSESKNKLNNVELGKIILRDSSFSINKKIKAAFMEAYLEMGSNKTQSYQGVTNIHLLSHKDEVHFVYMFEFECGSRVIKTSDGDGNEYEEFEEDHVVYTVNAIFEASYVSKEALTDKEINKYADEYVIHHVWPYWREYFQNALSRMDAPKLQVALSNGN